MIKDDSIGDCGVTQPAANNLLFICQELNICATSDTTDADISHTLCNEFYNYAFENNFHANNSNHCWNSVDIDALPEGYKMGYDESRKYELNSL